MRIHTLIIVLVLAVSGVSPVRAQDDDQSAARALELSKELVAMSAEATEQTVDAMLAQMIPLQLQQIRRASPELTDDQMVIVEEELRLLMAEVMKDLTAQTAGLFAEAFTVAELEDILAFNKSPTGRKALRLMPQLAQQGMQMGMQSVEQKLPAAMMQLEGRLRDRGIPL